MVTSRFPNANLCLIDNLSSVSQTCLSQYFHGSTAEPGQWNRRQPAEYQGHVRFPHISSSGVHQGSRRGPKLHRAANQLYLAQPSLSYQIRELESQLKLQIFERGGPSIRVTATGRLLVAYADTALRERMRSCLWLARFTFTMFRPCALVSPHLTKSAFCRLFEKNMRSCS